MEYKIGEVSKILNISTEMIRYYEKKGVLHPKRHMNNNYRTYSTMDVFLLMEMSRYQAIGFEVKQISQLLQDNYIENYVQQLDIKYNDIEKELIYKQLLQQRVKELSVRASCCKYNMHNYWVKEIPEQKAITLLKGHNDNYEEFEVSENSKKILFFDKLMPFFESLVIFEDDYDKWVYSIDTFYANKFRLDFKDEEIMLPSQRCLCTIIDMGEVGEFSRDCLNEIYEYMNEHGYKIIGKPQGVIIGRGIENEKFKRIMEIQIPIDI